MKGRPQEYMQVGMVHFAAFPEVMSGEGPVVETLETLCADDYFQAVEVTSVKDADARRRGAEVVKAAGNTAVFSVQPVLLREKHDLNSLDPDVRQASVDAVRALLPEAAEWGARGFAVVSGPDPGEAKRRDAGPMLQASLKELCEISRRQDGPPILLATSDRLPSGDNRFIGPTDEAANLALGVCGFYPGFGLAIDLSRLPLLGESPDDCLKAAAPFLKHVHIGNCVKGAADHPGAGNDHPAFGIPDGENGVDEVAAFLKVLLKIGYLGEGRENIVVFEVRPYGGQTSDDVIANAKETLDAAWAAL